MKTTPVKRIQSAINELDTSMAILRDTIARMVLAHDRKGAIKGLADKRARYAMLAAERDGLNRILRDR